MPAPENIPTEIEDQLKPEKEIQVHVNNGWGWSGIDHRKLLNIANVRTAIAGVNHESMENVSFIGMFSLMFPKSYINTIINETNKKLEDDQMNMGEFLRWIGVWLLLSTLSGYKRTDFWSMKPINLFEGAPYRFHEFMSNTRFGSIMKALTLMKDKPPPYKDRFWEVREMIRCWNDHMVENFIPSWE